MRQVIGLITVFDAILTGRQSGQKLHFPKLNFTQFVNRNVKILGRRLYSASLEDVAQLEDAQLIFIISIHLSVFNFPREPRLDVPNFTDKCMVF